MPETDISSRTSLPWLLLLQCPPPSTLLQPGHPGNRDGPFADIARNPLSLIHVALWALKNSTVFPHFTAEQFVAGILLTDVNRYLEPEVIWTRFTLLPAVLPLAHEADLSTC
jgi:hypothetical protein